MTIGHDCHASSRWTMSEAMMLVVLVEIPDGDRPSAGQTPLHSKAFACLDQFNLAARIRGLG